MPDQPEPLEKTLARLDAAHAAMMEESARNEFVYQAVENALGRIARQNYPALGNWQSKQLRALADKISRHAAQFTTELCELNFDGEREP